MVRLLQGDVGSGKTVVGFTSLLQAIESGAQGALLAPTEILARQHYDTIKHWSDQLGLQCALLTGRIKGKARQEILEDTSTGKISILIGTHALLGEGVQFQDLGLVVIDEQHRFGVEQRLALTNKGASPDLLVMSATPIPRTLLLAVHGDMECTRIMDKPLGRKPIKTVTIPMAKELEVFEGLKRALGKGTKAYWVCPLIDDSEELDLAAATTRYQDLKKIFGDSVGLVHGKMKGDEKEAIMAEFQSKGGHLKLLISTTVIEVGVDVKEATIMVIDHAERFGLAQLHQLRGRIGRNDLESTCILLYGSPLSEIAQKRLSTLRDTNDGFQIAEMDLKLRGAGEVLGRKQSGITPYRLADLGFHSDLIQIAHDDARLILHNDPSLQSDRGKALKTLLYLFGFDGMIHHLGSG
jgi:ATP-dependent DNA helicase RecG